MFSSNNSQVSNDAVFVEDIFSTYLYTGNGSTQTITNGIDLAGKGGLTWIKARNTVDSHRLFDTTRGVGNYLVTNGTFAQLNNASSVTAFNSNGFSLGSFTGTNDAFNYASWTFRKQPKFFDVVTYTGNGTAGRTVAHSLGSVPGCMIVRPTSAVDDWFVYHRSLLNSQSLFLNLVTAASNTPSAWNSTTPTSTEFTVGTNTATNANGVTYVAYLFAHNAGGFGLTGTDNVISCGSYTGNGSSTGPTVTLGYEPQWLLIKRATGGTNDWVLVDNMRGFSLTGNAFLYPDLSNAESSGISATSPTATGFQINTAGSNWNTNGDTYIYIAIRRGPMKVPTSGTSVFAPVTYAGNATSNRAVSVGFPVDWALVKNRTSVVYTASRDRMVGNPLFIDASGTGSTNPTNNFGFTGPLQDTHYIPESGTAWNASANNYILEAFKRAPSFMDIVCYTGTGTATALTHNLTVAPELIFVVSRSLSQNWNVYAEPLGNTNYLVLNLTNSYGTSSTRWNNTSPTSTQFTVGTQATVNSSGATYVAYLFATCAGVSKVGSYTGTGALQTINCGFTSGARFVMIKYADGVGDWYYWDSARGISSGNDPYLAINSTAAETTGTNYVDTDTTGFKVTAAAPAELNSVGGTYIFLAIA